MRPILKGWLQSSASPEEVSRTVTGFMLSLSFIVATIAQIKGVPELASNWSILATQTGSVLGATWALYGIIMKIVYRVGSVKPSTTPQV